MDERSFRGVTFAVCRLNFEPASVYSFDDETGVRDRDWLVQAGDVVADVGSAYGSYAVPALAIGATHVHCVNPNTEEQDTLAATLAANGWADRATLHRVGVHGRAGYLRDDDQAWSDTPRDGFFAVTTLDALMPGVDRLDWMKLDVEGAEADVLRGSEGLIQRCRPRILVENHRFVDVRLPRRVRQYLETLGYRELRDTPYHSVSHALFEPRT
jgi:FkbM family methyltransferase